MAASVLQAARQEVQGDWSECAPHCAPLWRRPSHGPGSRSQSADPPALAPLERKDEASHGSHGHGRGRGSRGRDRLLKPSSRSPSSEGSCDGRSEEVRFEQFDSSADGCDHVDPLSSELHQVEQELEERQHYLLEVKANGRALEEKLEETEKHARHFQQAVLALEAGLREADAEESEPHRELRSTARGAEFTKEPAPSPLDTLVGEWARARAAIGLD
ncbi:unnamed protein product [Durusdinium trenchii]|uniref:Uncharacterized protein n=2 Tax=Durusdinium trenchii TaxID=1381693 RepID=A0ABP0NPS7_9DINO